ncbi:hypothetical protein FOZ76_12740 [Verticiella sediminum]|uniref:Mandelate racemase/muconate lactonizing enzyme C-terminal domain-containing protein n=1 Tax=Verticiella sediminum TaxID=1247510 RepID=A0A556AMT1_9BURK|nr:enolase C-terminal domain-like protein [Verticiella sediminum]TSH94175.1 hypothetical protein FOZ76_12740 [Verticiella sediminum]
MTRIARVDVLRFHRTLDGRAWNPSFRWRERQAPLLAVHLDNGAWGLGEAWSAPADPAPVLAELANDVAPRLLGMRIDAPGGWRCPPASSAQVAAAWSAADMACWDAHARTRGIPLWRALGGTDGVAAVYASGGLYRDGAHPADLAAEMRGYVAAGHTAVKMKIGALGLEPDCARVAAVRAAVGPGTRLWADAVNQLTRDDAPAWCERLRTYGVQALQAPLPFDDVAGMADINRSMPVIATEAEYLEQRFAALLEARAVGYLQFCLGLCGGFSGAQRLDAQAAALGVPSTPQTYATAVMQTATLHFAAASRNVAIAEYHEFHDHLRHLAPPAARRIAAGRVALGDAPGMGIAVPAPGRQADRSTIEPFATLLR